GSVMRPSKLWLFMLQAILCSLAVGQSLGDLARTERAKKAAAGNEAPKAKVLTDQDVTNSAPAPNGPSLATGSAPFPWQRSPSQPEKVDHQPSTAEIRQMCRSINREQATEGLTTTCMVINAPMDSSYEALVDRAIALKNELCANHVDLNREPTDRALAAKY